MPMTEAERLIRLEARSDYHDREIAELRSMSADMSKALKAIDLRLKQIFWLGLGASTAIALGNSDIAGIAAKLLAVGP
ncbi:MAG TPA: hypothetical protein PKA33_14055 [Amaricoccus sp.]|uniref:hypothetical protein n=1 Tax=Amaricoccus sp. TaxID=1872485 RepID=UPI002C45192E|nr:hypothetical protein [Amaricoccus sp.]HMQ93531.1 hypothetical protein [Amaricoccus sp.]HMR53468.1 hypothetical protein [Amaricoccus sp.]HMR58955.1 hypothetical protein [Amaricoccus sp.]HMU00474.1 hypothetical protein [Amaricoccus sp.]